jgi:hypothetical protein
MLGLTAILFIIGRQRLAKFQLEPDSFNRILVPIATLTSVLCFLAAILDKL